mmetsp:Transcript_12799/g.47292  ORF Transcript_12799/g.47292 Transcript_12799/m.47292 type:complete len:610 (-) Transcript_12799:150-1979(-)
MAQFCDVIEREHLSMVHDKRRPSGRHSPYTDRYPTPSHAQPAPLMQFGPSNGYSQSPQSATLGGANDLDQAQASGDCIVCRRQGGNGEVECSVCGRQSHLACYQTSRLDMRVNDGFTCAECCAQVCDPFFEIRETIKPTPMVLKKSHAGNQQLIRVNFKLSHAQLNEMTMSRTRGVGVAGNIGIFVRTFKLSETSRHADHMWPKGTKLFVNTQQAITRQRKYNSFDNKWKGFSAPTDITLMCRSGRNALDLQTSDDPDDKYALVLQIAKLRTDEEVIEEIAARPSPSIEEGYHRALSSFQEDTEPDLVVTHTNLSLKCPLSLLEIGVPGRGKRCTHLQCFDIQSFIGMNRKPSVGRWRCGVCNSILRPADLIKDKWMEDMIRRAPQNTVDIKINQDGTWQPLDDESKPLAPPRSLSVAPGSIPKLADPEDVKLPPEQAPLPFGISPKVEDPGPDHPLNGVDQKVGKGWTNGFGDPSYASAKDFLGSSEPNSKRPPDTSDEAQPRSKSTKAKIVDLTLSSDEEDAAPLFATPPSHAEYGAHGPSQGSFARTEDQNGAQQLRAASPEPELYALAAGERGEEGGAGMGNAAASGIGINEPAFDAFLDSILQD